MEKNVGRTDSVIRIIVAVILLYFMDKMESKVQIIMVILAAALILTALKGYCLLYLPFNYSSRKKVEDEGIKHRK